MLEPHTVRILSSSPEIKAETPLQLLRAEDAFWMRGETSDGHQWCAACSFPLQILSVHLLYDGDMKYDKMLTSALGLGLMDEFILPLTLM